MPQNFFSFEQGSPIRIILGIVAFLLFVSSALMKDGNYYNSLFFIFLAIFMTWREYSAYMMKKQEDQNTEE